MVIQINRQNVFHLSSDESWYRANTSHTVVTLNPFILWTIISVTKKM